MRPKIKFLILMIILILGFNNIFCIPKCCLPIQSGCSNCICEGQQIDGFVKLPEGIDEYLYLIYNGSTVAITKDNPSFLICEKHNKPVNVLITKATNISAKTKPGEKNTILYLYLLPNSNYELHEFKTKSVDGGDKKTPMISWNIKKSVIQKKKNDLVISENTLIIPLDPNLIKVKFDENAEWESGKKTIKFPTIILSSNLSATEVAYEFSNSALAYMNLKPFNSKPEVQETQRDKTKVCITED